MVDAPVRESPVARLPARLPVAASILLLALVYLGTGLLGLQVAMPPENATALWPPSGLGLSSLLVWGRRVWPGVFFGALVTNLITFPRGSGEVAAVLGPLVIAAGSVDEIVLAATLVERFAGGRNVLDRATHVPRFVAAIAVAGVVNASGGLIATVLIGGVYVDTTRFLLTWWLGDITGMLVLSPLVFHGAVRPLSRPVEWVVTLVLTIGVSELLFGRPFGVGGTSLPLAWAILPAIVWAAVRPDLRAVVLHALIIHVLASWGILAGVGILAGDGHLGLVILDGLLAVTMVTGMLLCSSRLAEAEAWRILEDTGPGIAAEVIDRIFEPLFTIRSGHGHGLGLPTAAAIVAQAGGVLVVDSSPGHGATFSGWLPAVD